MAKQKKGGIDWTDDTWNPTRGCSRVSPGCGGAAGVGGCYAEKVAGRFSGPGLPYHGLAVIGPQGARWTGEVRLVPEHLADPLRWKRPRRVFVNSMSDLFHEKLSDKDIDLVFAVMALAPQHTFQILTKRPARMLSYFTHEMVWPRIEVAARRIHRDRTGKQIAGKILVGPLANCWLGVTAEDQKYADERIPLLLQTPAAKRFVSVEPQLSHVDLSKYLNVGGICECDQSLPQRDRCEGKGPRGWVRCNAGLRRLDWVIQGCESGHGARQFDYAWAYSMRDQCRAGGVAYFLKQMPGESAHKPNKNPELEGRTWKEFPR